MRSSPKQRRLKKRKMSDEDLRFLTATDLFNAAPEGAGTALLACLARKEVKAGERFIHQGEQGNGMYLIQDGSCSVIVEREGALTRVARRKEGDLVGEMALVTGEKRAAHVEAEMDMILWRISRVEFDELCLAYPGIREFITEIVTGRISESKVTRRKTIGKYVISEVIGEGSWSIVYKGIHQSLGLPVAIKMLKHNMAMDADFLERFNAEARIIAQLNHPNIVRVHDIEHIYRTIFIVMEHLSGEPLEEILVNVPQLPFPTVLDILIQVARGLQYAHSQGIVHQDIKPANIFIEDGHRTKLLDFGLARPIGSDDDLCLAGTPHYMAPEQIGGEALDGRTDIYAFGITAFEMATGRKPFHDLDVGAVLKAHRQSPTPDPCLLNPDLPGTFNAFIQRATSKDPSDRHQSAGEVVEELAVLAGRHGVTMRPKTGDARKMISLLALYREHDEIEVARLIEEFNQGLKDLGAELHVASYTAQ